jgi:hypothetical protein
MSPDRCAIRQHRPPIPQDPSSVVRAWALVLSSRFPPQRIATVETVLRAVRTLHEALPRRSLRSMSMPYRPIAKLQASRQVPVFLIACRAILTRMAAGATFAGPPVSYALVSAHLDALAESEHLTVGGPVGAASDRNVKLAVVRADMRLLLAHVQGLADADLERGQAIIESAGFSVKKRPTWRKPAFAARYTGVPGELVLDVRSVGRRAAYHWQMSVDLASWADLPETVESSTTVAGLTPATVYYFRCRTLSRRGLSDWGDAFRVIAH